MLPEATEVVDALSSCPILMIGGAPRSGTTLMAKLLDAHPEAVVFPKEFILLRDFYMMDEARRESFVREDYLTSGRYAEGVLADEVFSKAFNERKQSENGKLSDPLDVDHALYLKTFLENLSGNKSLMERVLRAHAVALYTASRAVQSTLTSVPKLIVHKIPFLAELYAGELFSDVSGLRMLHMKRHPVARFLSAKQRNLNRSPIKDVALPQLGADFVTAACMVYYTSEHLRRQHEAHFQSYHTLRYEGLVQGAATVLKELCGSLGITFSETMLRPSSLGDEVSANSAFWKENSNAVGSGIDSSHSEYAERLERKTSLGERQYLWGLCQRMQEYNDYPLEQVDVKDAKRGWSKRFKNETLKQFFRRRLAANPMSFSDEQIKSYLTTKLQDDVRKGCSCPSGAT